MDTRVIELSNGLRVIHTHVPHTRVVHCGYVIHAGSRDDRLEEMGMAHFLEHMVFKGTERRKTFHVLNYLESVGGELDAYTTKESTCFYATIRAEHAYRATDLLTDITFHSTFPDKEIVKEKQVITEEISHYRNAPDEAIFEDFDTMLFPNHTLGNPILGTPDSLGGFTRDKALRHLKDIYTYDNVIYAIAGNISAKEVDKQVAKHLSDLKLSGGVPLRIGPNGYTPTTKVVPITGTQAHEIVGRRAYAYREDKYYAFMLVNNLLGGPAMNNKLNLNIREKHGLTYSIQSFYSPYMDSGIWGVYYACEPKNLERVRMKVRKELDKLMSEKLSKMRLHQAKQQLIGQLTLGYESVYARMMSSAKEMLSTGKVFSFASYIKAIEEVSAEEVLEVCNDIFDADKHTRISYVNI